MNKKGSKSKSKVKTRKIILISICFILNVALAVIILTGINKLNHEKIQEIEVTQQEGSQRKRLIFKMPDPTTIFFDKFLIPVENNNITCISLRISIKMPKRNIWGEILNKKMFLRALIYDQIANEIKKQKSIPPLERLKVDICHKINGVLRTGKIEVLDIIGLETI